MFKYLEPLLLFLSVIVVSIYLRLPLIYYGLPYVLNPEEGNNLLTVLSLNKHPVGFSSFDLHSLFIYINALLIFISCGTFNADTILNYLEIKPALLYILPRLFSIFLSIGSVVLVYLIGKFFNSSVALLASGFLAISFLHVKFSHIFSSVNAVVFFVLLATFFALRVTSKGKGSIRLSILSAFFASSFSYIGVVGFIPVLVTRSIKKSKITSRLILLILFLYLLVNPRIILDFSNLGFASLFTEGYAYYPLSAGLLHIFTLLPHGIGPVVWLGSFLFIFCIRKYELNFLKIIFSVPLIYIAVLSIFHLVSLTWSTLLVPYFCIASALFFNSLHKAVLVKSEYLLSKRFFFIVLLLFAFYLPLKSSLRYNRISKLSDSRVIATEWINENASGNVRIAWDKNSIQPSWFNAYDKRKLNELFNSPWILFDRREFEVTNTLLKKEGFFKYLRKKVDYVVISSLDEEKVIRSKKNSLKKSYYAFFSKQKPVTTFNPYLKEYGKNLHHSLIEDLYSPYLSLWKRERPGPLIKIYKI